MGLTLLSNSILTHIWFNMCMQVTMHKYFIKPFMFKFLIK